MRFCTRCGKQAAEDISFCPECGNRLETESTTEGGQLPKKRGSEWGLGLAVGIIGTLIMIGAGAAMASIRSVRGDTVAEAFYNSMGWGFIGLGIFCMILLCFVFGNKSGQ